VLAGVLATACAGDPAPADRSAAAPATTTPPTGAPTTTAPPVTLPPAGTDGPVTALVTAAGVVVPVLGPATPGTGAWPVRTPCGGRATVAGGTPLRGATVVLDPGHGGDEPGAIGANGLAEKDLNLAVATEAARLLEARGATVVLTRTADYRVTIATRAELARRLAPRAMVSVHHNAEPDGPSPRPGTEAFFQVRSPASRRLAGLVHEELAAAFSTATTPFAGVAWQADTDAGAKYRRNRRGEDFYGILRATAGVPAVLAEALFLSNPAEAELLARPDVQRTEAAALDRAVTRFLTTADPGSGFVEPYPRSSPAGPGGGRAGCVDPPLG